MAFFLSIQYHFTVLITFDSLLHVAIKVIAVFSYECVNRLNLIYTLNQIIKPSGLNVE